MIIDAAQARDLPEVRALLERHGLPLDGVSDLVETMLVVRDEPRIVGTAALELYADGALLRSVVVDARRQGRGLGHELTVAALHLARTRGAGQVFLLTTTAEAFFRRLGFDTIARDAVPLSVQTSVEFQYACPASATVMQRRLTERP